MTHPVYCSTVLKNAQIFFSNKRISHGVTQQRLYSLQGCGAGVRWFLGASESGVAKFCLKMPDSLEMSRFYVKNLWKCEILKKYLAKIFFLQDFLVN